MDTALVIGIAGILASAAPIVFAAIGETIIERAGVINLSVNGAILLTAMAGFAVAVTTGSVVLGLLTGAVIGALVLWWWLLPALRSNNHRLPLGLCWRCCAAIWLIF